MDRAYGHLKVPKIENEAITNNILSSLRPIDENLRRHEQDSGFQTLRHPLFLSNFNLPKSKF